MGNAPPRWGIWGCAVPDPGSPGVRALPHVPVSHLFPPKPWFGQEGRLLLRPRGATFSLGHSARNPRLPVSHVTLSPLSRRHIPLPPPRERHDPSCCCCDASKHPVWFQSVTPGGWFYFLGGFLVFLAVSVLGTPQEPQLPPQPPLEAPAGSVPPAPFVSGWG